MYHTARANRRSRAWPVVACVVAACLWFHPASAKGKTELRVGPGPTVMSPEEKAIQADPAAGIEHAVILLEETERDEDLGTQMETAFHLRAKILSNEGRDLANVEIPFDRRGTKLRQWWGRTIQPDGTVLELPESRLERQSMVRSGGSEMQALKAALPGVVPGSVIDYGYVLREEGYVPYERIPLQRKWPIRELHFRWKPYSSMAGAYRLVQTETLDVDGDIAKGAILVNGRNLPPVTEEPLMPPWHEVQAALVVYYVPRGTSFDDYWEDMGKSMSLVLKPLMGKKRSLGQALAAMNLDPQGNLDEQLRAAYAWIDANIARTGLRTFEELQAASRDQPEKGDPVANLLSTREGSAFQIQLFYIGVARALGADAHLVFVPDRTVNIWDQDTKTLSQFDSTLVVVRSKGAADEEVIVIDPGSGLRYGEVPWRFSGVYGMMITKSGARPIEVPGSAAKDNVAECVVEVSFVDDNEAIVSSWIEKDRGQVGLDERRYLRQLSPRERAERIDQLCGVGPETDITNAGVVGLEDLGRGFELHCENEFYDPSIHDRIGHYMMGWSGPWLDALPDLPAGDRTHPIVFPFPRVETLDLTIDAPKGFVPEDPPPSAEFESSFGKYSLRIARTESSYKVERLLALYETVIPPEEYEELRDFIEQVRGLDRTPLEFTREGLN